ncbi:MAG: outer membrane beta-barrel protein [Candidatus Latescibacteria bacterium]|nr:outer membrane beta-barrel protein [Candidatus Latescibacterota bacterium]
MKRKRCTIALVAMLLLLLTGVSSAQDYVRVGASAFVNYNMPMFALRRGWYNSATKWGASLLYSMNSRVTMEFEYHRAGYHDGKIEDRTFLYAKDGKQHESPNAAADMQINSVVINFMARLGDQTDLFKEQMTSVYVVVGGGFYDYNNTLSGMIFPGQTSDPLDPTLVLEPQQDTRTALGANVGLGLERFLTKNLALDFRVRHNFVLGQLLPREAWDVKEAWPMQMLDFGVAVKFYESIR